MSNLDAITRRKSCREYNMKPISSELKAKIQELIEKPFDEEVKDNVKLEIIENGKQAASLLKGLAGYNGVMIEAPHYLAVLSDESEESYRFAGFFGEHILFELMELRLGSLWIHVMDSPKAKEALSITSDKKLIALLAFGEPLEENFIAKFFQGLKSNKTGPYSKGGYGNLEIDYEKKRADRKATSSFVSIDDWDKETTFEELENRGLEQIYSYMKYAPSWGNRQPWKFLIKDKEMILAVEKHPEGDIVSDNLDAGIAMYYFDIAMNSAGLHGSWTLGEKTYEVPNNYSFVGIYALQ